MKGSMEDLKFLARKPVSRGRKNELVTGTDPEYLELYSEIIELRVFHGLTYKQIGEISGYDPRSLNRILKLYYPKQGEHDIVMSIMSKV